MSEELETAIDVPAVLNELEWQITQLHNKIEWSRKENRPQSWAAYDQALSIALKTQEAITRLVMNNLTVTAKKESCNET